MPSASDHSRVFVLDNGGGSLKAGYSSQGAGRGPRVMPNCIMKAKSEKRRAFVGDQIDDCRDLSSLFYLLPIQKGYLVNWDHQKTVWDYVFGKQCFNVKPEDTTLIFTEPFFNFTSIQEGLSEMFFEEFSFSRVLRTHAPDLSCYQNRLDQPEEKCCLVVDSGFSFTHFAPYVMGRRVRSGVRRLDVGGKLLTNHLKEIVSYRQLHVLDETHVMNACKEDCCFVSTSYSRDVALAQGRSSPLARDYVLPDFTARRRGYMKGPEESSGRAAEGEQIVRMNNERFMVPEVLFRPSDIGISQAGLAEGVVASIQACEPEARPWLYRNILLTGGSCSFPGMAERLEGEVRSLAPAEVQVVVRSVEEPALYPWQGGASLARDAELGQLCVTREEWAEKGFQACQARYYL